jgi:chromosome segregation ATPase
VTVPDTGPLSSEEPLLANIRRIVAEEMDTQIHRILDSRHFVTQADLRSALDQRDQQINAINEQVAAVVSKFAAIQTQLATLNPSVQQLAEGLGQIEVKVKGISSQLTGLDDSIEARDELVRDHTRRIGDIESDIRYRLTILTDNQIQAAAMIENFNGRLKIFEDEFKGDATDKSRPGIRTAIALSKEEVKADIAQQRELLMTVFEFMRAEQRKQEARRRRWSLLGGFLLNTRFGEALLVGLLIGLLTLLSINLPGIIEFVRQFFLD